MSNELLEIQNRLRENATLRVALEEEGVGEFLFVQSPNRAVEVYLAEEGIIIEYWNDADEQSDESACKIETVRSTAEAAANVLEWLH